MGYWVRRALAFELVWRLAWSFVLIPFGYLLVNWYVDAHLASPEMTNIGVLIDFLNPLGITVLVAMALIATVATVYELNVLALYAARIADQTPPTSSGPYREAFYRLANLLHPSTLLAIPFYALLIPLVHAGATATPVPALTVPRYALEVLCAPPLGMAVACLAWLLVVFCAMATMAVPVRMACERTCFLEALRQSVGDLRRMPGRARCTAIGTYAALVAAGLLADACIPLKPLQLQDFNVYLLRYAVNSDLFRWRMAITVAQWLALAGATMVIAIMVRRAMDRPAEPARTVRERQAAMLFDSLHRVAQARGMAAARRISAWAGRLRHRRIVAVMLVLAMVWLMAMYLQQRPVPHGPIVIGHRGTATAAENSLQAISEAAAEEADVVEIDVQLTGDGEVVVFHDPTTARLSPANITPMRVREHSLHELQQIKLRSRGMAFTMPTLRQAIHTVQRSSDDLQLLIELKPAEGDADRLADLVIDIVEDERFVDRTMIMSMDQRAIGRVRERRTGPEWRVGYCVFWALGNLNWPIGADFVALEESQFTTFFVEQAREMGVPVYVWTVNDSQRAEQYLETGAAGIITDEVTRVGDVVNDYASDD
ncbi:glycerophosphodiester phosphodiesterase family protein [Bifidobacterium pullorum]|uniref:glycerophosphodiester phosphodiesterase family protein n=1 Tax=Bifidobacterium pullorum TaxID=78448 RepID=UPI003AF8AF04